MSRKAPFGPPLPVLAVLARRVEEEVEEEVETDIPLDIVMNTTADDDDVGDADIDIDDVEDQRRQQQQDNNSIATDGGDGGTRVDRFIDRTRWRWPWQRSWIKFIRYNLMLRVDLMATREEIEFIESRVERGLPIGRFEMKTRIWHPPPKSRGGGKSICGSVTGGKSVGG